MFAASWLDNYDEDFGVYAVFSDRDACLDYLVETVFQRAEFLSDETNEVKVLDSDGWKNEMTREQVRDQLAGGMDFCLVLKFSEGLDGTLEPLDTVTMGLREVEVKP